MRKNEANESKIVENALDRPDAFRLDGAREQLLHERSTELLIMKCIWWLCAGLQTTAIVGSMIFLFHTQSTPMRFLCVVVALIAHEGMVVAVLWSMMTNARMDMLRQLKGMELQLAELRTSSAETPLKDRDRPHHKTLED